MAVVDFIRSEERKNPINTSKFHRQAEVPHITLYLFANDLQPP